MPDVRQDTVFIGRSEELRVLVRNLQRGRHTLLVGPEGIGKTRMMQEAASVLSGEERRIDLSPRLIGETSGHLAIRIKPDQYRIIFVYNASPLGNCLKEIAGRLHEKGVLSLDGIGRVPGDWESVQKRFTRMGVVRLQECVCESIRASSVPFLIFFDTLDRIAPPLKRFLEILLESAVVCASVVYLKDAFHFKKIWLSFTRIDLEPLEDLVCDRLITHCLDTYNIKVLDRELYRREILKSANGNPFHIKNLIWQGSRETHVTTDEIRKLRRSEEGEYFNMGPIYIFLAGILTLARIFSFGTDNREFYIYFSSLGFIVYLIFRVFRTFFLFRPQRRK